MAGLPQLCGRIGVSVPIIQAPMAGAHDEALAVAVSVAGGLGSLACALYTPSEAHSRALAFKSNGGRALNMNFFCHEVVSRDPVREQKWRRALDKYYRQYDLNDDYDCAVGIHSFDEAMCDIVCAIRPQVVSFHFGLPHERLLERIRSGGSAVFSTATTPKEAEYLRSANVDAIILQGRDAGGHQGSFLDVTFEPAFSTFDLLAEVSAKFNTPLVAAGGIMDGRDVANAMRAGASAVQMGTRFLKTPEATIASAHRAILEGAEDRRTAITNVFTGRPARSLVNRFILEAGPIHRDAQTFPLATAATAPIKAATKGLADFIPLWAGTEWKRGKPMPAGELVGSLWQECLAASGTSKPKEVRNENL